VLRTRAATFPALRSISTIAERLNLKDGAAYRAFRNASPFGIADDAPWPKDDTAPIDQEYFVTGAGRKPSIFHSRPPLSVAIRNYMPPGSVWFTDISLQRPPDHQGHCYSRLFAEEHCGYASTYYSASKDSDTLTRQLDEHATWVRQNVPGGCFSVLRCDFASEIVRQNHGDDYYTQALSRTATHIPVSALCPARPTALPSTVPKALGVVSTASPTSMHAAHGSVYSGGASWNEEPSFNTTTSPLHVPATTTFTIAFARRL
jgi:hypothetical protein